MHRAVLIVLGLGVAVRADATQEKPPCRGCTLDVASTSAEPVPLVVVLHGDTDNARERATKWRDAVLRRGWALLSLDCPAERGCSDGSWYKWDGGDEPAWVRDQVREVIARHRIDATRVYLVGWSGGATFIGKYVQEWPQMFAATVIHGGGVPPLDDACPDLPFPAYFLVGDKNPTHGSTKRLRAYFDACQQEVRWDLVPGANHPKEDAALTRAKADQILAWLATKRRNQAVATR